MTCLAAMVMKHRETLDSLAHALLLKCIIAGQPHEDLEQRRPHCSGVSPADAVDLLDEMPHPNPTTTKAAITAFCRAEQIAKAREVFEGIKNQRRPDCLNAVIVGHIPLTAMIRKVYSFLGSSRHLVRSMVVISNECFQSLPTSMHRNKEMTTME